MGYFTLNGRKIWHLTSTHEIQLKRCLHDHFIQVSTITLHNLTQKKQVWGKLTCDLKYQISSASCREPKICFCTNSMRIYWCTSKGVESEWVLWRICKILQFPSKFLWDGVTYPVSPPPKGPERNPPPHQHPFKGSSMHANPTCFTEASHVLWNTADVFQIPPLVFPKRNQQFVSFVPHSLATQTPHMQFHLPSAHPRGRQKGRTPACACWLNVFAEVSLKKTSLGFEASHISPKILETVRLIPGLTYREQVNPAHSLQLMLNYVDLCIEF